MWVLDSRVILVLSAKLEAGPCRRTPASLALGIISPEQRELQSNMNKIEATWDKSDYEIYDDFLNIKIDGTFIDELVDKSYPGYDYKGTVPTLIFWMQLENERKIVWNRILPRNNETTVCPILMCPDDCDFSCTIIVARITRTNSQIIWEQLGSNLTQTTFQTPQLIGTEVEWFDEIEPMTFELSDYEQMIADFYRQLKIDEQKWQELNKTNVQQNV